ncbi:MAG: hypothetical protein AB1Z98_33000 [Nannocystaceae bacterium]
MGGFKDFKDIKDVKEKELKEFKEKEKEKEFKEKDKELKEKDKEKEKEFKEFKEKDPKEIKEKDKDIVEQPMTPTQPGIASAAAGPAATMGEAIVELMRRVERIEKHLGIGKSFIEGDERPDVGERALGDDGQ